MDKYGSAILGITVTRNSGIKSKRYYGVLRHDLSVRFHSYFNRPGVRLGGRGDRCLVPDSYINQSLELGRWTRPLVPLFYLFQFLDPFFFIFYFFTYTHISY